jgi:hypothetical protein
MNDDEVANAKVELEWAEVAGIDLDDGADVALTKWQESILEQREHDLQSGVAWHPAVHAADEIVAQGPDAATLRAKVQRDVASWFVQTNGKFIKLGSGPMQYSYMEMEKLLPQMIAAHYENHPKIMKKAGSIANAALQGTSPDPRMTFGIYSGKSYPLPGNSAKRLYRDGLWDINLWQEPSYRRLTATQTFSEQPCAFQDMLTFAIPDETQRNHLLDWVSWCLQNEAQKPTWSILLYSEEKGTGKSTIGEVLEALFGADNTSAVNGIRSLTQRFAADVLSKKLIVAEEVHISSFSDEGNALKDVITNDRVTVEPKYQAAVTIPQKSCFLFTTNHKPLWLEGGERRYYVIEVSHDGSALGPKSEDFSALVGRVKAEFADPQKLRDLYARLMARTQGPTFNAKNLRFADNATPIMRELQAISGNEGDEVLEALLSEYCVEIIPSADFPELINFLKNRNAKALRNALARLGWEERRLRLNGKQVRTWAKKGLEIEHRRISSSLLAAEYKPDAITLGYTWFDLDFYSEKTWVQLRQDRLKRLSKIDHTASGTSANESDNPDGKYGPFNGPKSHLRYQTVVFEREALASRAWALPPHAEAQDPDDDLNHDF